MNYPMVSIVIPAYKASHFEQTLRSAIGQTYSNIEIIVSDNCPTEDIREICGKFNGVIYQRSSVFRVENVTAALFSGKGQFIKPLFDDDILHPFCVERMVSAILPRDNVEMVFSASGVINALNQRIEVRRPFEATGSMSGTDLHRMMTLGFKNPVGEFSSILFRRAKLWELGPAGIFSFSGVDFLKGLGDIVLYWNLTRHGVAFYIDEELSYFRKDQSLPSNSNPSANPDFGYCMADYIDLLIESHVCGAISLEELLDARKNVESLAERCLGIFPQVLRSVDRYNAYSGIQSAATDIRLQT